MGTKMDLLHVILYPDKAPTCFLCFKRKDETLSVNQELFICDDYHSNDTTLADIMKHLFPSFDILCDQACEDCSKVLIGTYTRLQRHYTLRQAISTIASKLELKVSSFKHYEVDSDHATIALEMPIKTDNLTDLENNDYSKTILIKEFTQTCEKCDMKFDSKESLLEHCKIAHKNTNHAVVCEFCGKHCKTPSTLRVHLNCHKEKVCPYCSKTLKTHSHFKIHLKNHVSKEKQSKRVTNYSCNLCSYKSESKSCLEAHTNKVHLQKRPYTCDVCYKSFYRKSNLTEHISIHDKVKNFTCEVCGDDFVSKKTLTEHIRLHTGEKPYECGICNKRFVSSGRRSDHIKSRHMEKTNCCYLCDKKFGLRKDLNSHLKKFHSHNPSSILAQT